MRVATVALVTALAAGSLARADPPAHQRFTLYKFQNRIGTEDSVDDGRELRTVFTFTDRTSPVPLASVLERGKDGAPVRFQIWGNTSRLFNVDDRVVVEGGKLTITQRGQTRSVAAPARFFVGSAYAPVTMTQELLHYWASHGKPASLPVFPIGTISIERRGEDTVTDQDGKSRALERFAIGGLGWGKETVWLDDKHQLAALTGVDTEFDHFEATGRGFGEALGVFVARAAQDGLEALGETSRGLRVDGGGDGTVAYVHARLIDGTGAPPVADAVVVIDGGKITAAGPSSKVSVPAGARTVDATGATLVPGLWDMHAHFEQVEWGPVYLAAGVTTVRDCGNELDFVRAVRDTIDAGKGVGPRLLLACIVDGEGPGSLGTERLTRTEDIPALIKKFKAAGCAQVKIYQSLDPRLIRPLAAAAHAAGLTVTGHVPTGATAVQAVTDGYDQINHAQFLMRAFAAGDLPPTERGSKLMRAIEAFDPSTPAARKLAGWFAAHHTVLDPTLALGELALPHAELVRREPGLATLPAPLAAAFSDAGPGPDDDRTRRLLDKSVALIGLLHKAGVPIVAGTDQAVPGHSLHRELEIYVEAGFTPMEALQAATIVPARAMKKDKELGTIEAGKRADFLLVDGDPLADIHALRKIRVVVTGGRAYDPAALWRSVGFTP
ncbi:MAG TPA: amidohydrolase family protein [Kofleriaceae bacterium]|nr:amidohydrolase family protein [Kofleriaceae bacterium]